MPLKRKITALEEVDEAQRALYKPNPDTGEGGYVLDLEGGDNGAPTVEDIANLRKALDKERALREEFERASKKALSDDDSAEFDRLKREERERREKKSFDEGDIDTIVEQRVKGAVEERDQKIEKLQNDLTSVSSLLEDTVIESAILKAAAGDSEAGRPAVVQGALSDALLFARGRDDAGRKWAVGGPNGRSAILVDADDNPVYSAKDGTTLMAAEEWLGGLLTKKRHWFGESQGAGGEGDGGGEGGGVPATAKRKDMTDAQAVEFIDTHGSAAYAALTE